MDDTVARTTPLSELRARMALRRLLRLGLVSYTPEGDFWEVASS